MARSFTLTTDQPIATAAEEAVPSGDALILNFSVPSKSIYRNKAVASVTIPVSVEALPNLGCDSNN